jgi:MarR family transcriptional regulator for hemolysin
MEHLNDIIFYTMDRAEKSYRQYAQKKLKEAGFNITVDQWLVLKAIEEDSNATQQQISQRVFKDVASVTRIVELLVKNGWMSRSFHSTDRRRFNLQLTEEGQELIERLKPFTAANRKKALEGVSSEEIQQLKDTLEKIIKNVSE